MISESKILINRYGQKITIKKTTLSEPINIKAFIQPLRSDYQSNLYGDYSDQSGTEQFLYIGPPTHRLTEYPTTTRIIFESEKYIIKKSESVYFKEKPIYERAVLEKDT